MHDYAPSFPGHARSPLLRLSLQGRRYLLIVPSCLLAAAIVALCVAVLRSTQHSSLDWFLLIPFGIATAWECILLWQLVLGFAVWASGARSMSVLEHRAAEIEPVSTGRSRTALLIPIFDEDTDAVFAGVRIMLRSLARTGGRADVDVHILSDTRTAATIADEEAAWSVIRSEWPDGIFYSRRADNFGRKAGNIQSFLDRCGDAYDFAIVLDADSLMSGSAMRRLIRLMEEHPRIGLIQTVSFAAARETLFARIQQFAIRLYAPLALRGLQYWQGHEGSYWGHNAIFRIGPFRQHCRLPILPGKPPLGGEILCHDVVEGALMVRAGWEVHLLPRFDGTWEEMPTNTIDLLQRERRWCQGNLQHLRVLAFPGLRAASRAHITLGIGGYVMAPLWWAFLVLGVVRVLGGGSDRYGLLAFGLTETGAAASALVAVNVALIVVPRLLHLFHALGDTRVRRSFGGARRLLAGAAVEQAFWVFLGPVLSLITSSFVFSILTGRATGWTGQTRADREISMGEAFRCHAPHMAIGLALALAAARTGGWYALWMAPVALGLIISPALTIISSRIDLGQLSRRSGLFLTTDDLDGHLELRELNQSRS